MVVNCGESDGFLLYFLLSLQLPSFISCERYHREIVDLAGVEGGTSFNLDGCFSLAFIGNQPLLEISDDRPFAIVLERRQSPWIPPSHFLVDLGNGGDSLGEFEKFVSELYLNCYTHIIYSYPSVLADRYNERSITFRSVYSPSH